MLRIIYISSTLFIVIFIGLIGGVIDIIQGDNLIIVANKLGYPLYFFSLLGVCKILGALILLLPKKLNKLYDIAYYGFTFDFIFAAYSHFSIKNSTFDILIPLIILIILLTSKILKKNYSLYDKNFKNKAKI